jgi:hypothetical protein
MTDVDTLIRRIDQELGAEVKREKVAWEDAVRANRERGARLSAMRPWPSTSSSC